MICRAVLREKLAALAHESWAGWTDYMIEKLIEERETYGREARRALQNRKIQTPAEPWDMAESKCFKRWRRQIGQPYSELSEPEKDSDRKESDKVLEALRPEVIARKVVEATRELLESGHVDADDWKIKPLLRRIESLLIDYDRAEANR